MKTPARFFIKNPGKTWKQVGEWDFRYYFACAEEKWCKGWDGVQFLEVEGE